MRPTLTPSSIKIPDAALTRTELAALKAYVYGMGWSDIYARYLPAGEPAFKDMHRRALNLLHKHKQMGLAYFLRKGPNQSDNDIKQAVVAISEIEKLGAAAPSLDHLVNAWFIKNITQKLESAGIKKITDLIDLMNNKGASWWRHVPGFGVKAGLAITNWAQANRAHLGVDLKEFIKTPSSALTQRTSSAVLIFHNTPALAPLERMRIKSELSGEHGRNRENLDRCRLHAKNDYEAISTWLSLYPESSHTYRAYRKEAERFLLWCIVQKGIPLSGALVEDCIEYREFLKDPTPRFTWVGATTKRFSDDWRPFQGSLSHTSAAHAITILKSMFEWLRKQGYLSSNPFDAIPKNNRPARIMVEKALSLAAWQSVYDWGLAQTNDTFVTALAFLVIMRDCGLRRTEVVHLKRGDLVFNEGWLATFMGKGARFRTVPLSKSVIKAIEAHLATRELTLETMGSETPLIAPKSYLKCNAYLEQESFGYTEQGLWRIIKGFFKAYTLANGLFEGRDLSKVTPHQLRHTFGVNAIEKGVPIDVVQQTLGHASLSTTTIYSQGDIKRRTKELEKLFGN